MLRYDRLVQLGKIEFHGGHGGAPGHNHRIPTSITDTASSAWGSTKDITSAAGSSVVGAAKSAVNVIPGIGSEPLANIYDVGRGGDQTAAINGSATGAISSGSGQVTGANVPASVAGVLSDTSNAFPSGPPQSVAQQQSVLTPTQQQAMSKVAPETTPIWQTEAFASGKETRPWHKVGASWLGGTGSGGAWTEDEFMKVQEDFEQNFWESETRALFGQQIPSQTGLKDVLKGAIQEASYNPDTLTLSGNTLSNLQNKVQNWTESPGMRDYPWTPDTMEGEMTKEQRKILVYNKMQKELESAGIDADAFIKANVPQLADVKDKAQATAKQLDKAVPGAAPPSQLAAEATPKSNTYTMIVDEWADSISLDPGGPGGMAQLQALANLEIDPPAPGYVADPVTGEILREPPDTADADERVDPEVVKNWQAALNLKAKALEKVETAQAQGIADTQERAELDYTKVRDRLQREQESDMFGKELGLRESELAEKTARREGEQENVYQQRLQDKRQFEANLKYQKKRDEDMRNLELEVIDKQQMYDIGKQVQNQAHEMNIASMDDSLQRDLAAASNAIAAQRINLEHAWNEGAVDRATAISDNQYDNDMKLIFRRASAEQDTLEKTYELDSHFGRDPAHLIGLQGTQDRLAVRERGKQDIKLAGAQGVQERLSLIAAGTQERLNISDRGTQERLSIQARGAIDKSLENMRQNGQTQRLADQIKSDEFLQGNQITSDEAMQKAELQMRMSLQNAQLEHAVSQLDEQGAQALAQIGERGKLDKKSQMRDIQSREFMQGRQISAEEAMQMATAQAGLAATREAGAEERLTLREQQTIAEEERAALGTTTGANVVTMAREAGTSYVTGLNAAMTNATAGNYDDVETALAQPLPPSPAGIAWDTGTGTFQQRAGFEGREMDAQTQEWIASVTPAFKARDRAEQAIGQARQLQLESDLRIRERRAADDDFRQAMMTADIDTAEEAITRQRMAETQQLEVETKMQNMQMLLNLLQNPVQLGMAKRHGLLGQIETALGFQMGNVPTAPASGASIPTPEEWSGLDNEDKAFRIATFVEQGGSPEEFMQMIAAGSPGQMQQVQYGVL